MTGEDKDFIRTKEVITNKLTLLDQPDLSAIDFTNGTNNVTISNVAPAGVGTATISRWVSIIIDSTVYYIPCWT